MGFRHSSSESHIARSVNRTNSASDRLPNQICDLLILERQLAQAAVDEPIEAVFLLREYDNAPPSRASVAALLKRVCRSEHPSPVESTYLARMGALIVRACPQIIRQLIAQPEVEIACANRSAL